MQLVYSVTVLLVDLSVAIVQMTVSVTITYFRSFCSTYAGDSFCRGYVGYNFHCNYADGSLLQLFRWFFLQCVMRMTVAIMLIYKELFKNTKMSKMLLRIGFVNTEVKNLWWLKKNKWKSSLREKHLPRIALKASQSLPRISGNLLWFTILGGLIRGLMFLL